jgi:hypothetical protein
MWNLCIRIHQGKEVKLSLFLTKHRAIKTYWGNGGVNTRILTSALGGGEWSASLHSRFMPRERTSGT